MEIIFPFQANKNDQDKKVQYENLTGILITQIPVRELAQFIVDYCGHYYCECTCHHQNTIIGCTNEFCNDSEVCTTFQITQTGGYTVYLNILVEHISPNSVVFFYEFEDENEIHFRDGHTTVIDFRGRPIPETNQISHAMCCNLKANTKIRLRCKYDKQLGPIKIENCFCFAIKNYD